MGWFSIASIALFAVLIVRSLMRLRNGTHGKAKNYLLILIFCIHIGVIVYLSFD